jgi:hypothetical protein
MEKQQAVGGSTAFLKWEGHSFQSPKAGNSDRVGGTFV